MTEYNIKSTDTKNFSLTHLDKEIGTLKYEKWFSLKSEIILANDLIYQIVPKGFWGTTIELKKGETILLDFKMNWNGNIIIRDFFDKTERDFIFKPKGILSNSYILLNREEQPLLTIQSDFKWSKFNYDYIISTTDDFDKFTYSEILLLTIVHCTNYYITNMTNAMVTG